MPATATTELRRNSPTGQSAQSARQGSSDQVGQKIGRGVMISVRGRKPIERNQRIGARQKSAQAPRIR